MKKAWRDLWRAMRMLVTHPSGLIQPVPERHVDVTMSDGSTLRLTFSPGCSEADYWRALRWVEDGPWTTPR